MTRLLDKALVATLIIQGAVVLFRQYLLLRTGYLTSDEANYIVQAMQGTVYGARYFWGALNIAYFHLFGVNDWSSLVYSFQFSTYLYVWVALFLGAVYKSLDLLGVSERSKALTMLSISFLPTFTLHSAEFVSETPALALGACGVWFWLRFDKGKRRWSDLAVSAALLFAAYYTRNEYGVFLGLGAVYWLLKLKGVEKWKALSFLVFFALVLLPTPNGAISPAVNAGYTGASLVSPTTPSGEAIAPSHVWYGPLVLLILGLVGGFGLLAVVGLYGFYKSTGSEKVLVLGSVLGFLAIVTYYGWVDYHYYTHQGVGTIIRWANPAVLGFVVGGARGFEMNGNPHAKGNALAVFSVALVLLAVFAPVLEIKAQGNLNLPYDVLSPQEYGPLQARDFLSWLSRGYTPYYSPELLYINNDWKVGLLMFRNLPGFVLFPDHTGLVLDPSSIPVPNGSFFIAGIHPVGSNCTQNAINLQLPPGPIPIMGFVDAYCTWKHLVIVNSTTGSLVEVFP